MVSGYRIKTSSSTPLFPPAQIGLHVYELNVLALPSSLSSTINATIFNATMEPDAQVVITSSTHPTATWPHATVDCLSTPPCPTCYCYVCDVPLAQCDDHAAHASADGKDNHWNVIKRRRNALVNTWPDIPALVNLIVSLSVEEAVRRTDRPADAHDDVCFVSHALEQVQLHAVNNKSHVKPSHHTSIPDAFVSAVNPVPKADPLPSVDHVKVHAAKKATTPVKTDAR